MQTLRYLIFAAIIISCLASKKQIEEKPFWQDMFQPQQHLGVVAVFGLQDDENCPQNCNQRGACR